jgi:o-succinylbenzoate synthase
MQMPLETAHGTTWNREGVLLCIRDRSGAAGYGETMPLPGFGLESLETARSTLEGVADALVGEPTGDWLNALALAHRLTLSAPGARAAAETALLDLESRIRGVAFAELLGGSKRTEVSVGALLAARTPREVRNAARHAVSRGFRTLKLKIAVTTVDRDVARVQALRDAVGGDIALRLDANAGWDEDTARAALARLEGEKPEFVEQPVASNDVDALVRLRAGSKVPIAADESAATGPGAAAVIERHAADLLILKPATLGGPRAALAIARRAASAGLGAVVTGFLDSAIGDAAALQVAAALDAPAGAAGLGTQNFFVTDLAPTTPPLEGTRILPEGPGLGSAPDDQQLAGLQNGLIFEVSRC